jgi:lipopolysaccharide/colanic/teichoic acid biosynthesis glycosyltransferase
LTAQEAAATPQVGVALAGPVTVASRPLKRCFDVVAGISLLLLLSPLMATIAVVVRLTSPGPALFRQTRVGRGERPFVILKFRTMHVSASDEVHRAYVTALLEGRVSQGASAQPGPQSPNLYKLENDPRVTRSGRWLRRTSLDELPQLVNVVRGDMSLVGPRPVLPFEASHFQGQQRLRFAVRPGLTGLWQVSGRSRVTFLDQLALDARYVQEQSMLLDLRILARTIPSVLAGDTR